MIEQREIGKIQPKVEQKPIVDANAFVKSADATFLGRLKKFPGKARHALSFQKLALTASAFPILAACTFGSAEKQNIPPPPTPTAAASEMPTGIPSQVEFERLVTPTPEPPSISTPTPEPTPPPSPTPTLEPTPTSTPFPTETPTPKVEIQQPKVISMGGTVEPDPTSLSAGEKIKLLFPEGIINGESPLIPKGDTLSVWLELNSNTQIHQLRLSISDLLGIKNNEFSIEMDTTKETATVDASAISSFKRIAKFSISDADQEIIKQIKLSRIRDNNRGLVVNLSLPNKPFTYTDKDGSHLVNPAERFVSGEVGLGINRRGKSASGTATTPIALAVENIKIENGKGVLVATADRFDITPPRTPVPTRPPEATQVPVKPPIPTIETTKTPTPKSEEEKSKWIERKWAPNETVPIEEWWNDMVSKGYISIDSIAQQYAGERINSFLKGNNLVPNPVKYGYGGGHSYINNCNLELDKLVNQGQGHIKITQDAYTQIPGGAECQIFTKGK